MNATGSMTSTAPPWLEQWSIAYPHVGRPWTVRSATARGVLTPEPGTVEVVDPAADRRLPGLAKALESGRLVGYRAGRRAIVRSERGYVKVLRPSRVAGVVEAHRRLAIADVPVRVPEITQVCEDGRVELEILPGPSVHESIRSQRTPRLSIPVEGIAEALIGLHRISPTDDPPADEGPHVWATMAGRAEPEAVDGLLRIADRLAPPPAGASVLVHGDLHDKNIIVCGRSIGLIDLDGVRTGIAEDELANLGVHLQLRCLQSGRPIAVGRALAARLYRHYGANRTVSEARVHAVERHTWFRLACLYRFRRASRPLVPRLLELAVGR